MRRAAAALLLLGCGGSGDGALPDAAVAPDLAEPPMDLALADTPFVMAPHRPFPEMPSTKQQAMTRLEMVTIVAQNELRQADLFAFDDAVIKGPWWDAVAAEYGIGQGVEGPRAPLHIVGPPIDANISDSGMLAYVDSVIADGAPPDGKHFYLLYLPEGIKATDDNGKVHDFCGYHHWNLSNLGDGWGFTQRCDFYQDTFTATTVIGSHEIIEAATDPGPGGWHWLPPKVAPWLATVWAEYETSGDVEVGDWCEGTAWTDGVFTFQRSWSNAAAAAGGDPCAPALQVPYENVTAEQDWYEVAAGAEVQIPLTGWSDARVSDWALAYWIKWSTTAGYTAAIDSATHITDGNGKSYASINNARTATLRVTAPANAPSGDWAVIVVYSFPPPESLPGDRFHMWLVGVHVP